MGKSIDGGYLQKLWHHVGNCYEKERRSQRKQRGGTRIDDQQRGRDSDARNVQESNQQKHKAWIVGLVYAQRRDGAKDSRDN